MSLLRTMDEQWAAAHKELNDLRAAVRTASLQRRAEVAGAVPNFPDVDSLPAGHLGAVATVSDDGTGSPAFFWHNGVTWQGIS